MRVSSSISANLREAQMRCARFVKNMDNEASGGLPRKQKDEKNQKRDVVLCMSKSTSIRLTPTSSRFTGYFRPSCGT